MSFVPSLKLATFRALEWLSALRQPERNTQPGSVDTPSQRPAPASLWLFVSTIGELNAIAPLLERLRRELGHPALTLITDRDTYEAAYRARHPDAAIERLDGTVAAVASLKRRRPPLLLLVAEIPALLHDAPCRLSYATLQAARSAGAPCVLLNGWLYGYAPPSRLDLLEQRWFGGDYVRAFDLCIVQTDAVRQRLLERGAEARRVVVAGNVKFDAMPWPPQDHPPDSSLGALGAALRRSALHPLIVAGSVTETADQNDLLQAFRQVHDRHPGALLVLAPRHPENLPRMAALRTMLEASGLPWTLRSTLPATPAALAPGVLVLDTMGELRGCYAAATLAFVGTDHNVLEPLGFGKPVFVGGHWEPTYPSFPVYEQLRGVGAIHDVGTLDGLGPAWCAQLEAGREAPAAGRARLDAAVRAQRGAVQRHLDAMRGCAALHRLWSGDGLTGSADKSPTLA